MSAGAVRSRPKLRRQFRAGLVIAGICALVGSLLLGVCWFAFPFPLERLDRWPVSPIVLDRHGRELLSLVDCEGQWGRPVPLDQMSPWLLQATVAAEDARFYSHPGVDVFAILRAIGQDCRHGRIVSGASTLSMQVAHMLDSRPRTWRAKLVEAFRALQFERLRDKQSILATYLNIAPYGGNLRGVEAAARAYFGKQAADLSLDEAALLAGLPQSPARYRPDRHPATAAARRETVLRRMELCGFITPAQRALAAAQPVVLHPAARRFQAPHAAFLALRSRPEGGRTCLDLDLQREVESAVTTYAAVLPDDLELAVVVIEISSGDVVALVGSRDFREPRHGQVNGALARRSPGSALKPFVYAAAFETNRLGPASLLYDVPITRAGWRPGNFDRTFVGPLSAAEALRRSLNVPALLVAEGIGLARCVGVIESAGVHLSRHAMDRSGLAVVVGASEVTLLDLTNAYATLGRGGIRQRARIFLDEAADPVRVLDAHVCAVIDDILSCRQRRPHGSDESSRPWFMWKTGTSSRRRDAWAVGHDGRYAIGVWAGYFSGAGAPGLVGAEIAEPLLATLFCGASLRVDCDPPPPQPWIVRNPLPPPAEVAAALRITAPSDGSTFLAIGAQALIRPDAVADGVRANAGRLTWFLNGRLMPAEQVERLSLPRGQYELRCADSAGHVSAVRFHVR